MPTYKYRREDGTTFTIKQKMTDDALEECPETGQEVERVITGGMGFQLKGGGWYDDGYASPGAKQSAEGNGSASGNGSGSDGKSDKTADATKADGASPSSSEKSDASAKKSDAA